MSKRGPPVRLNGLQACINALCKPVAAVIACVFEIAHGERLEIYSVFGVRFHSQKYYSTVIASTSAAEVMPK